MHTHPSILSHHYSFILGVQSHSPHLVTQCLLLVRHCYSRFPFPLHMTQFLEFVTHTFVMLLGTLHPAFLYSSPRAISFGHVLVRTLGWFDRYSSSTSIFGSLLETSQRELGSLVWPQRHFETSFCFRIRVFVLVCQPERICVLLVSLWGSPWFFGRVHFIPLTIHTSLSLQCSYSLHS